MSGTKSALIFLLSALIVNTIAISIAHPASKTTTTTTTTTTREDFFAIAHQMNTIQTIDHAMAAGANGVEIDLRFDDAGNPTHFHHGHVCDCDCYLSGDIPWICTIPHICSQSTDVVPLLQHLNKFHDSLALIWIDSKTSYLDAPTQASAARKVFDLTQTLLYDKGYKGKILVGSPNAKHYLETFAYLAHHSHFGDRYFFSKDELHNDPLDVLSYLSTLSSRNLIYDDGLTACSPEQFYDQILVAHINKLNGVVSAVFAWTIDSKASFDKYYKLGARGIITNRVVDLVNWTRENDIVLSVPGGDHLHSATSKKVITPACDCSHQNGGCVVSQSAPPFTACQCKSYGYRCTGTVALCADPDLCKRVLDRSKGTSVQMCVEGGGDCDGYEPRCQCQHSSGGCKITTPAQPGTACHCTNKGAWTCKGHFTRCLDPEHQSCKKPDTSVSSCVLGGGNCDAYAPDKCKCEYHSGGCRLSVEAPPHTACQCSYLGAWTCSGYIVMCKDPSSQLCQHPDTSKESCLLGGGDCGAYD